MAAPLEGVRVIDFGRYIAAPYCGMVLAELGADVIRVERREGGEDRMVGPVTSKGEGGMFHNINRNKRGITLNLGAPESKEVVRKLVESADVVIVNMPIKLVEKLGLDYESLKQIKEDIIMVLATAFGTTGPYATRVGFDGVTQAMSGAMHLTGFEDAPVRDIVPFVDYGTAQHAAIGVTAALYQRQQTKRGQMIEVSLLETSVTYMTTLIAEHAVFGTERERIGNAGFFAAPSDSFATKDGWLIVATVGDYMFACWAKMVGHPEMIDDPRFKDDISRGNNYKAINEVMAKWCGERTREQAIAELEEHRLPCGPVYSLKEILNDPQVDARGILQHVEIEGEEKAVPLSHVPLRMTELERKPLTPAPRLGQHTEAVLKEVGFDDDQIKCFREKEVI